MSKSRVLSTIFRSTRVLKRLFLTKYYPVDQVKGDGISKACGMHAGKENKEGVLVVKPEAR
jgi:hypothetical protein